MSALSQKCYNAKYAKKAIRKDLRKLAGKDYYGREAL